VDREKLSILKMIEEGRVTAEEGLRLLEALDTPRRGPARPAARRLRVRVSELGTGRTRAQVNIPLDLVDLGLRWAARSVNRRIRIGEIEIDPKRLSAAVRRGDVGRLLDYTDDDENARVEIILE